MGFAIIWENTCILTVPPQNISADIDAIQKAQEKNWSEQPIFSMAVALLLNTGPFHSMESLWIYSVHNCMYSSLLCVQCIIK